jgi:hypothetical protein
VTVVALEKRWNVTRDRVYQVLGRKLRLGPFGFIPSSAQDPLTLGRLFHLHRDTFRKFLRRCSISKLNLFELCAALDEMHMRVVKSGQQKLAASIDHFGLRTAPQMNVSPRTDGDNAVFDHGDCFGFWTLFIYRVNGSVSHNQCCRRFRLRVRVHSVHNYQDTKCEFTFHDRDECRRFVLVEPAQLR